MAISITPSQDYEKRELAASDKIKSDLNAMRSKKAQKKWTFDVGYTTALDFEIKQISGLKPPDNWLELAKQQDVRARGLMKTEQKPLP